MNKTSVQAMAPTNLQAGHLWCNLALVFQMNVFRKQFLTVTGHNTQKNKDKTTTAQDMCNCIAVYLVIGKLDGTT